MIPRCMEGLCPARFLASDGPHSTDDLQNQEDLEELTGTGPPPASMLEVEEVPLEVLFRSPRSTGQELCEGHIVDGPAPSTWPSTRS